MFATVVLGARGKDDSSEFFLIRVEVVKHAVKAVGQGIAIVNSRRQVPAVRLSAVYMIKTIDCRSVDPQPNVS